VEAIILAGGVGTRLKPITDYIPKPLIPINNIPIIEWQIRHLKKFNINDIIVCAGYKADQIQNYLEHKKSFESRIKVVIEKKPLGTGGAIKNAVKMIRGKSFLVLNGDVITNIDIRRLYHSPNSIALIELRTRFGTVDLEKDKITNFREKKRVADVWMNAGIYHLNKEIVRDLPSKGSIEETAFLKYAKAGKLIGVRFKDSTWFSIDSHKDIEECSTALKGVA
jgi:NDP-sugar pyrophosphorylase family protein